MSRPSDRLPVGSPTSATPVVGAEAVQTFDEHGARVQAMFTDIAHGYDRANRIMSMGIDVRWRRRAVRMLAQDEGTGTRLLDLCAGTLDSSLEMHKAFPDAQIVGGDFSAGMLEVGRRRLNDVQAARITAKEMDAHELPEPAQSFDGLFCAFGERNLSDLERATKEKARVLRPGARLVILEFFRPEGLASRAFHGVYNSTVLPAVGWACTGNLAAYRYLPQSMQAFVSTREYAELLARNGFEQIKVETLTFGVAAIVSATRSQGDATRVVAA